MSRVVILLLMGSFFQINHAMDHLIDRDDLKLISAERLPGYMGKMILYRWHKDIYVPVILGERLADTQWYYARYVDQREELQPSMLCYQGDLYRRLRRSNN